MPGLKRAAPSKELEELIQLFLKAEMEIVNEIARLRSLGLADYHAVAALDRVQRILRKLESDCWEYVPKMVEREFYVRVPEARKIMEPVEKHIAGYANAAVLTGEQSDIAQRLIINLMGEITEATGTAGSILEAHLLGRLDEDLFRQVGLAQTAAMKAAGRGPYKQLGSFVAGLMREGVTAFVDKAGRRWSLHSYGAMVCRTTSRQAEVLSVLTADPDQDLYQISSHKTTCPLCAPYEGRVYSRSGRDPDFPPLADAFERIDPAGGDDLANTYLNIHPSCLHMLHPWTAKGLSPEAIQTIKDFSDPKKNPYSIDPRTQEQREAYRKKEAGRRKWLADYRQWEKYRSLLGDGCPKTFQTFQKHKLAGDEKYKALRRNYRKAKGLEKYRELRYHNDGTIVVTDDWTKIDHPKIDRKYKPHAVVDTLSRNGKQHDRTIYDSSGIMMLQIHSGDHGHPKQHPFGTRGEHVHEFVWTGQGLAKRAIREVNDMERIQHKDILEAD